MFEFHDSKLGKVKVVNVTEARSTMASIMNDRSASYVITRNNRPIRVILNYDKIGGMSDVDLSKGVETSPSTDVSSDRPVALRKTPPAKPVVADKAVVEVAQQKEEEDHSISALTKKDPDYFQRFKKLYEPIAEPPPPPAPPKNETIVKSAPVQKESRTKELTGGDPNEDFLEPPAESEGSTVQRSTPQASPTGSPSLDSPRTGQEPPSIQDLLRELDQEKLSGEDDDLSPLNSSDLRRLFHNIS